MPGTDHEKHPVVDLSPLFQSPLPGEPNFPSVEQRDACNALGRASAEFSYCYLSGLPVATSLTDKMFDAANQLFLGLSGEEKTRGLAPITRPSHIGYTPYGVEVLNTERGCDMKEVSEL